MIVGGQRFPDTPAGYRYAARHVYKLGPTFYDDARGLASEADHLAQRSIIEMRLLWVCAALVAVLFVLGIWNPWK